MRYNCKWFFDEQELNSFCQKIFNEKPRFLEHFARGNGYHVERMYKEHNGKFKVVFFLTAPNDSGKYSMYELDKIRENSYEKITADRTFRK